MNEILTIAKMNAADRFAASHGVPEAQLMENAGRAVADAITARWTPRPVAVLCGPGNNGGDGRVVIRLLRECGWDVRETLEGAALIVDGLFGAGLSRPLEGEYRERVEAVNAGGVPVIAIDVPSGLNGDTGKVLGAVCIRAALTVTFFRKKPAHLLMPGRDLCGEVLVADIGIPDAALENVALFENGPALWNFPWPHNGGNKFQRGDCLVVSGPAHATGAARLAACGALRVGAGLVSVASPLDAVTVNAASLTAIMVKPFAGESGFAGLLKDERIKGIVIGPGVGVGGDTRALVKLVLAHQAGAVLDADALTSFRDDPDALFARLRENVVLTPHAGEFGRIFPGLLENSASRIDAARAASAKAGCVVLLKGTDTAIARPDGRVIINSNAPPTLATAGSGDVLSGLIGGLLAQGMAAFEAAACGAWLHGAAAQAFGPGLIAEDLPEMLPRLLAGLAG
jgi:hydroxyethylthiazole kinase-like uncharacterized protein yjeF